MPDRTIVVAKRILIKRITVTRAEIDAELARSHEGCALCAFLGGKETPSPAGEKGARED